MIARPLAVALVTALTTIAVPQAATAQQATALASHKSPFNCGKTFYANNWTPGHNPSGSIDWQSYGSDAINGENVRATAAGTAWPRASSSRNRRMVNSP